MSEIISHLPGPPGDVDRPSKDGDSRLRRIIESLADAVVVVDGDGVVQFVNPAAETLFDRTCDEMGGEAFGFPVAAGTTTELDLSGGRVAEMRVVELSWEGRPAWLASLRDITERKEAERAAHREAEKERERLEALRRELEGALSLLRVEERRKDQFMAVLGHELRNPLAGIDSGLRLLQKRGGEEQAEWTFGMMRNQLKLLTNLLDDLLDLSRIARGKLELRRRTVRLDEAVESAVETVRSRIEERGQHLSVPAHDDALAAEVDPARLEQVVSNLLINASKFSPEGAEIRVELRGEGDEAVLEVADRGVGIEPAMIDRIFEPFTQGHPGSPLAGGLGIGLTLVRQLVELQGGSVSAASGGPGEGSTFQVRLPRAQPPVAAAAPAASGEAHEGDGRRVLVVDDNEDAGRALAELLELNGCEVATAATGAEGLERARALQPDAVLLDLNLPDLSGYEVAEALRHDRDLESVLLIAVSGFGHEQALERSRESGIDHHLVKPVDFDRLLRLFRDGGP